MLLRPLRHAVEKLRADFGFQIADLLAQRGLGDTHAPRRAREIPVFRHGEEVADMSQLQRHLQNISRMHL
jgi:hypothetical protein